MLTTLATIGFGDFYPVSNFERLVGACILMVGVSVFSYVMSELSYMISHFSLINGEIDFDE